MDKGTLFNRSDPFFAKKSEIFSKKTKNFKSDLLYIF